MEILKKFDRYCQNLHQLSKTENLHSGKVGMVRKKLRSMIISMNDINEDITEKIELFWKVGYYLPISKYLKKNYQSPEVSTLLTMFCGEFYELLACAPKYSAQFNLYLGDLHRYMSENELQRELASTFYAKCIEIDRNQGRAFNMMALLKPSDNLSERARLFVNSLAANLPYNSEQNLKQLIESIQFADNSSHQDLYYFFDFIQLTIISRISKKEHSEKMNKCSEEFMKNAQLLFENDEKIRFFSACCTANVLSFKLSEEEQFVHSFELLCNVFTKLLQFKNPHKTMLLVIICEWIVSIKTSQSSLNFPNFLPMFIKNKWETMQNCLYSQLNEQSDDIRKYISETLNDFELDYLINGPKSEYQVLSYWIQRMCQLKNPDIVMNLNENEIFKRRNSVSKSKKLEIPNLDSSSFEIQKLDESWMPIYVLFDLTALQNSIELVLKIWKIDQFVYTISSSVLAKLDKTKDESTNSRKAIKEVHIRQKQVKVIEARNLKDVCLKLVESAGKIGAQSSQQLVAVLVDDISNFEDFEPIPGVTFYSVNSFYDLCDRHNLGIR